MGERKKMSLLNIDIVICFYMFVCVALLAFDFGYILIVGRKNKIMVKRLKKSVEGENADECTT